MNSTVTYQLIEVKNSTIVESGILDIKKILDWEQKAIAKISLSDSKNIIDTNYGYYLLEYQKSEEKEKELPLFNLLYAQLPNPKNTEIQSPKICGEFEYHGKYYLILSAERKTLSHLKNLLKVPIDDTTYDGMIINPMNYINKNPNAPFLQQTTSQNLLENLK